MSLFLPWYTYEVGLGADISGWILKPFDGWIPYAARQSYQATLPSLSSVTVFYIVQNLFSAVILGLLLVKIKTKIQTEEIDEKIANLMRIGPVITGALVVLFIIQMVQSQMFVPYLSVDIEFAYTNLNHSYSIGYGLICSLIGFTINLFATCILKKPQLYENEQNRRIPIWAYSN
jgi:uncharacterized membrane protein YeaQ/YmgE (transglycosylase-associated protein family)